MKRMIERNGRKKEKGGWWRHRGQEKEEKPSRRIQKRRRGISEGQTQTRPPTPPAETTGQDTAAQKTIDIDLNPQGTPKTDTPDPL